MERSEFINKLLKIFDEVQIINNTKDDITREYVDAKGKNGIYFLYNQMHEVIYVGMTADGETASVYSRLYGNGSGAHCNKPWFAECTGIKFKPFPNATKDDLAIIERLMIYGQGQPKYNDIGNIEQDYNKIFKRICEDN